MAFPEPGGRNRDKVRWERFRRWAAESVTNHWRGAIGWADRLLIFDLTEIVDHPFLRGIGHVEQKLHLAKRGGGVRACDDAV